MNNDKGVMLVVVIGFTFILSVLVFTAASVVTNELKRAVFYKESLQAYYDADTGVKDALIQLRASDMGLLEGSTQDGLSTGSGVNNSFSVERLNDFEIVPGRADTRMEFYLVTSSGFDSYNRELEVLEGSIVVPPDPGQRSQARIVSTRRR